MPYTYNTTYDCKCPCGWTYSALSNKGMMYRMGLHKRNCEKGQAAKINPLPLALNRYDDGFNKIIKTILIPTKDNVVAKTHQSTHQNQPSSC